MPSPRDRALKRLARSSAPQAPTQTAGALSAIAPGFRPSRRERRQADRLSAIAPGHRPSRRRQRQADRLTQRASGGTGGALSSFGLMRSEPSKPAKRGDPRPMNVGGRRYAFPGFGNRKS